METCTIELTAEELLVIARLTGILLGYAIPDRYCDRELIQNIYKRANEKIVQLLAVEKPVLRNYWQPASANRDRSLS